MSALISQDEMDLIDRAELEISKLPPVETPTRHIFTPYLYLRQIFMPAGAVVTSKIHKTEHPFIISQGVVTVRGGDKVETYAAPYTGITKPGTRRALYVIEDCVWTTCHALPKETMTLEEIEAMIIEPHVNQLIVNDKREELP